MLSHHKPFYNSALRTTWFPCTRSSRTMPVMLRTVWTGLWTRQWNFGSVEKHKSLTPCNFNQMPPCVCFSFVYCYDALCLNSLENNYGETYNCKRKINKKESDVPHHWCLCCPSLLPFCEKISPDSALRKLVACCSPYQLDENQFLKPYKTNYCFEKVFFLNATNCSI